MTNIDPKLEIGKVYSGENFNNLTKGRIFVKLIIEDENQFKTGLNMDNVTFNPIYTYGSKGLCFYDLHNFTEYIKYNDEICLRYVTIPADAQVVYVKEKIRNLFCVEEEKYYKTDK